MSGASSLYRALLGGFRVVLENNTVSDVGLVSAAATVTVGSDGILTLGTGNSGNSTLAWCRPPIYSSFPFRVRCTLLADGPLHSSSSATGTWLDTSTSRSWFVIQSGSGQAEATIRVEIGLNDIAMDSAEYILTATVA